MKKVMYFFSIIICMFICLSSVSADQITADEIENGTYIIGNYAFNKVVDAEYGPEYDGTLKLEHIILASQSLDVFTSIGDVNIYYKTGRGEWVNPINNEPLDVKADDIFDIYYVNNILSSSLIYGDVNEDGVVNGKDWTRLTKYLQDVNEEIKINKVAADLNLDGKITNIDLDILSRHLNEVEGYDKLPIQNIGNIVNLGDINNDDLINYVDLKLLTDYVESNSGVVTSLMEKEMDSNEDGYVNNNDVVILHKHILKMEGYETLPVNVETENVMYGDVNFDGEITYKDASELYAIVREKREKPENELFDLIADVDLNGEINYRDVYIIYYNFRTNHSDQAFTLPISSAEQISKVKYGDVNGDTIVNHEDLNEVYNYIASSSRNVEKEEELAYDLNEDGKIDNTDVIILHKHIFKTKDYETLPVDVKTENVIYGDANNDGEFNYSDTTATYAMARDKRTWSYAADLDTNGVIDQKDVVISYAHFRRKTANIVLPIYNSEKVLKSGDINLDGHVNYSDLKELAGFVFAGEEVNDGLGYLNEDMNLDGTLDKDDFIIMHNFLKGNEKYKYLGSTEYQNNIEITNNYIGDVNLDGTVNQDDVQAIRDYANSTTDLDFANLLEADVNLDGVVTEIDAILLEQHINNVTGFEKLYYIDLAEGKVVTYGDVDGNGVVDPLDISDILGYINGSKTLQSLQILAADVNLDGRINDCDVDIIGKHLVEFNGYETLPYIAQ